MQILVHRNLVHRNLVRTRPVAPVAAAMLMSLLLLSCGGSNDSGETGSEATSPDEIAAAGSEEEFNIPQEPDSFGGTVLKEEDPSATDTSAITAGIIVTSPSLSQGAIKISSAGVPETGWVVIHADGPEGKILGSAPLFGPLNPAVEVPVGDAVATGSQLWAGVYQDLGVADTFEPGIDEPFMEGSEPVGVAFTLE